MDSQKEVKFLPLALLLLLSLIWGSSFILMKKSLEVFTTTQVAAGRVAFAYLTLVWFAVYHLRKLPKDKLKYILLMGLLGNFVPAFLFAIAVSELKSSLAGVLNALTPLFTLVIGILYFKIPLKKEYLAGLSLGFVGSIGLSFINANGGLGTFNWYALLVVLATICYAISTNIIKQYLGRIKSLHLTSFAMFFVGPPALIFLFTSDFTSRMETEGAWLALFYLALLGSIATGFALIVFNKIVQMTSAVFASSVTYIIPIVAVFWGIIDGEQLFLFHYIGIAFIFCGIYLVNKVK